jgi:succinyl-diaminopimelate desuccinylase
VFEAADTPTIDNLYASFGMGAPHLCFAGHTDVVPVGDEAAWTHPPFSGEVVDGKLYGRGAADMKGGVAAFAAAAIDFVQSHKFKGTLSFLITGDEEGPAINGTVKMLQWCEKQNIRFDHCLVGEPTCPETLGDMIKIGRRGSLNATLTVHGAQGHVAYPHKADNPIKDALKILSALAALKLDDGNAHFQPSNLEITSVDVGNTASNVIPAKVTAKLNVRFNSEHSIDSLKALLNSTVQDAADGRAFDLVFAAPVSDVFITQPDGFIDTLKAAIKAETGQTPELSTSGGTSDARFIKNYCPVVEFGLVGQTMHKVDEHIEVSDLEGLTRIYGRLLEGYFSA